MYGYTLSPEIKALRNRRSGCILYTVPAIGDYSFVFGVDTRSNDLTDFGGSFEEDQDESCVSAACRELYEESLGVIDIRDRIDVLDFPCLWDDQSFIMFVQLDGIESFRRNFEAAKSSTRGEYREMSGIRVITLSVLHHCISTREIDLKLFWKPKVLLNSTVDIWSRKSFFTDRKMLK